MKAETGIQSGLGFPYEHGFIRWLSVLGAGVFLLASLSAFAQQNPKRLIMKDGSYQSATKWEVVGQRVRYYSAERYDWEELPNDLVDWPATDKYNNERTGQRDETIKEIAKADEADEREAPLIAPWIAIAKFRRRVLCKTNLISTQNLWS